MGGGCLGAGSSDAHFYAESAGGSAHHQSLTHRLLLAAGRLGRPAALTAARSAKLAGIGVGVWRAARLLGAVPDPPERQRAHGDRNQHHGDADKYRVAEHPASRAEHAGGQQRRAGAADQHQQPATDDGKHLTGT